MNIYRYVMNCRERLYNYDNEDVKKSILIDILRYNDEKVKIDSFDQLFNVKLNVLNKIQNRKVTYKRLGWFNSQNFKIKLFPDPS